MEGAITYGFFKIPKNSCEIATEFIKKFKSKASDYTIEVSGDKQREWYKILFKLAPEVNAAMKKSGSTKEKRYYHFSKFSGGALLMVSSKEPSYDSIELQKRSAQVFDLAYRRFKDLQKAEAQAREAQIEAALERVRSRTMGMQKSEELKEVIQIVYEQFIQLNIHTEHAGFIMDYKTRDDYYSWIADKFGTPTQVTIPYFDCPYYNRFNEAKEKGIDFFAVTHSLEEKNSFYEELFKHIPGFPEESKKIIFICSQIMK